MNALRESTVVAMSLAAVVSYGRVFDDWSFLATAVVFSLASHGLCILGRRLRWPLAVNAVVSLIALVLVAGVARYSTTLSLGVVPTGDTARALGSDIDESWSLFSTITAPTEALPGFIVSVAVGAWITAFLADWAAFRLRSPAEAVAPSALLWFVPALFASQHQAVFSILYLLAVLAYLLAERVARVDAGGSWLGGSARVGRAALLAGGAGCALAIALLAMLIAPGVPGGDEETAAVAWRDIGDSPGAGKRPAESPLVEVRSQLVDLSDEVVFTVEAEDSDYWRLSALDKFDEGRWEDGGSYGKTGGTLGSTLPESQAADVEEHTFTIAALRSSWLPAAYEPISVDAEGVALTYREDAGAILLAEGRTEESMQYTVESAVPARDAATLAAATDEIPGDIEDNFLNLPDDFSPTIRALAEEITADSDAPGEKALALLEYFDDNYRYNIAVDAGHGIDRMETFIEIKEGYCEQFATTYGAMARAVGLPTRVAVGYSPGEWNPVTGVYEVRGEHAHAWNEVYLGGLGWTRFDPTPDRANADDEDYTGIPAAQAGDNETTPTVPPSTVPGAPDSRPPDPATPSTLQPRAAAGGAQASGGGDNSGGASGPLLWILGAYALAMITMAALWLFVRRRRARHLDPVSSSPVTAAWRRATSALALRGVRQRSVETPTQFARRTGEGDLVELASMVTEDRYSRARLADGTGRATELAEQITTTALGDARPALRLRWLFDPRTVRAPID